VTDFAFTFDAVRRGPAVVLRNVAGSCAGGAIHAVLGPNGAGKSTLLRAFAGIDAATGAVHLGGVALHTLSPEDRARHVAWVPQTPAVPDDVTVEHVVSLARARRGESRVVVREKAHRALAQCGVERLAARTFSELSAGQRQRVVIARALATDAPLLLLDEPFSALDLQASLRLDVLLRELATRSMTVLVVMHDLAHALRLADRVLVLANGSLVAAGPPRATLTDDLLARVWGVRPLDASLASFTLDEAQ
jgi:iron complex transport system ATP-binding protein